MPYSDPRSTSSRIRTQADIVSGVFDVPFTRVYAGTLPLGYQLEQFLRWGYGPAAGLLSIVGIALLLGLAIRTRSTTAIVLGSWFGVYGAVLLLADVKFLRYLEPLAPVFAVGAALALSRLGHVARLTWPRLPRGSHTASGVEPGIRLDWRIPVDLRS